MAHEWIFICYRRKDSAAQSARLFEALNVHFPGQVFQDVASIDAGDNWTEELRESVLGADVLVVVIGPEWQSMVADRGPRINDPADYVHGEVRTALEHDIRIIPILLQGAQMPPPRTLPPQLEGLLRRQALPLHDATFDADATRLIARLQRVRQEAERIRTPASIESASRMPQELAARRLAAHAESHAVKPQHLPLAALLALESMLRFPLPGAHGVLRLARAGLPRCEAQLAHAAEVTAVTESSSGKWIATGSADGVIKVWDADTLTLAAEHHAGGKIGTLLFGAGDQWLAAASADCKLQVWELASGNALMTYEMPHPIVQLLLQTDAESASLVGLSREFSHGRLMIWNARTWKPLWGRDGIRDVAGQAQQPFLAIAWGDHVVVAHTVSGQIYAEFSLQAAVTGVSWHATVQVFAAATVEGTLWRGYIAPTKEGQAQWQCERLPGYANPVMPLALHPEVAWLAYGDGSGLGILNLENLAATSLPLKGQFGIELKFSNQGSLLAALSPEDRSLKVWRLPGKRLLADQALQTATAVLFGVRKNRMISASHENSACVWELPSGEPALWKRDLGATMDFVFDSSGNFVAWVGKRATANRRVQANQTALTVLRAVDGEIVFDTTHDAMIDAVAFDASATAIALRSGQTIRVFNLHQGEETPALATAACDWFPQPSTAYPPVIESLAERETIESLWSSHRTWLVTRHPGRIRVWDGTTLTEQAAFPIALDTAGICISPDEGYLAIGGGDGDLQIRALPQGAEVAVFPHDGAVTKFAFSPDSRYIIATGIDAATSAMWIVSPKLLIDDVRRRLQRDLTRDEWELYVGNEPYLETRSAASVRLRRV